MRIITLKAENVKRLRAIEVTPEGDVVAAANDFQCWVEVVDETGEVAS